MVEWGVARSAVRVSKFLQGVFCTEIRGLWRASGESCCAWSPSLEGLTSSKVESSRSAANRFPDLPVIGVSGAKSHENFVAHGSAILAATLSAARVCHRDDWLDFASEKCHLATVGTGLKSCRGERPHSGRSASRLSALQALSISSKGITYRTAGFAVRKRIDSGRMRPLTWISSSPKCATPPVRSRGSVFSADRLSSHQCAATSGSSAATTYRNNGVHTSEPSQPPAIRSPANEPEGVPFTEAPPSPPQYLKASIKV